MHQPDSMAFSLPGTHCQFRLGWLHGKLKPEFPRQRESDTCWNASKRIQTSTRGIRCWQQCNNNECVCSVAWHYCTCFQTDRIPLCLVFPPLYSFFPFKCACHTEFSSVWCTDINSQTTPVRISHLGRKKITGNYRRNASIQKSFPENVVRLSALQSKYLPRFHKPANKLW